MLLVRTPYALMMTGHMAHAGARRRGATVVPGDNRSVVMPYARVIRVLHDLGVTLTWSLPTETLIWAQAARAAGYEPARDFPALRALFVAGEPLSPARRRRIGEIWDVPVLEEYGSTETGPLAGQCPADRLHLWADRAVFEVHDPRTGQTRPEGTGQLVVTMLGREAMPLLRYNLEDDVEVSYEACPCGWELPTVRVLGRSAFGHRVGRAVITQAGLEERRVLVTAGVRRYVLAGPHRWGYAAGPDRGGPTGPGPRRALRLRPPSLPRMGSGRMSRVCRRAVWCRNGSSPLPLRSSSPAVFSG